MLDDIKGEITIPIPFTNIALNWGKWATAVGKRYNYMRRYDAVSLIIKPPQFRWTPIVEMKERAEWRR